MAIKIKYIKKKRAAFDFTKVNADNYFMIDMTALVSDTAVVSVAIKKVVIKNITNWVNKSLEQEVVPEVGGFLLGVTQELESSTAENKAYKMVIDCFAPSTKVDFSSPNRLVFGREALLELDGFQQEYPNLKTVGWFHTHPGHTPFLSTTDSMIHEGFFTALDEIAIVLDCKTEEFNTGFFTRKQSGLVNNQPDLRDYVYWRELQEWAMKKQEIDD
jgi:proteasome lid subunit RPN8/RPN11